MASLFQESRDPKIQQQTVIYFKILLYTITYYYMIYYNVIYEPQKAQIAKSISLRQQGISPPELFQKLDEEKALTKYSFGWGSRLEVQGPRNSGLRVLGLRRGRGSWVQGLGCRI